MIKTVISDLGKVIIFFDNNLFFKRIEKFSPYSLDDMMAMTDQFIPLLRSFDRGNITPDIFFQGITAILKAEINSELFFRLYNDVFTLNPPVLRIIKSLKINYQLILLSNTDVERFGFIKKKFPEILIFDHYILSYETGYIKPHPAIYKIALENAFSKSEECLFIDDLEKNISAASKLGIHTIHLLPDSDLKSQLHSFGVVGSL